MSTLNEHIGQICCMFIMEHNADIMTSVSECGYIKIVNEF